MWPFKRRAAPLRFVPGLPYVDGATWAAGATASSMSPQACEALTAVASCVSIISETVAALPAVVTRDDGQRTPQPDHALSRLVVEGCNANESWSDLITSLVASALLRGNGLAEILADDRGQLAALRSVPFAQTTPWITETSELLFDYLPTSPPNAGQRRRLLRDDVILLKARSDSGVLGVSPLQRSANALQHALTTQTHSFRWMANASRPSGTITSPGKVSEPTMNRLQQDWDNNYSNERFGKTAVLPEGLKFEPLGWLSASDAQLVERLSYTVRDVARAFQVPVFLLADETRSTFASASAALSYFSANTLRPWVVRLERAFQQSVLTPRERLAIDLTALLKADPDAFAAALLKMRQGGYVTANECRAMLGLPAHPDGDSITPPSVISASDQAALPPGKQWTNGHDRHA